MSLLEDEAELRERNAHITASQSADPLRTFRWPVDLLKRALHLFVTSDPIEELYGRGANDTGKSTSMAAYGLLCAQKRKIHDGVRLPQWDGPVEIVQFVVDYQVQLLTIQPAYLRLLGAWPHRISKLGPIIQSIRVMPEGGDPDNESGWSIIHFFSQKNRQTGTGLRADVVLSDEPIRADLLSEIRKAGHAFRPHVRIIYVTPVRRREWAHMREDYGESPRSAIRRVDRERAEVRWSWGDVESWLMPKWRLEKLRRTYERDILRDAREHGDYTNDSGSCPLDVATLMEMANECVDLNPADSGVGLIYWPLNRETENGVVSFGGRLVEVYELPEPGARYYQDLDPSSGMEHGHEAALHISKVGTGNLCVRFAGTIPPFSLGYLGAGLARQYNEAASDIEMNDRWGSTVYKGFVAAGMAHVCCHEQRELSPGEFHHEVGWEQKEKARNEQIGSLQTWLADWKAGIKYARCPSRSALETLMEMRLDLDTEKIVAGPGSAHGHDAVLIGQKLRRPGVVHRINKPVPDLAKPARTDGERLADIIMGRRNGQAPRFGHAKRMERPKW